MALPDDAIELSRPHACGQWLVCGHGSLLSEVCLSVESLSDSILLRSDLLGEIIDVIQTEGSLLTCGVDRDRISVEITHLLHADPHDDGDVGLFQMSCDEVLDGFIFLRHGFAIVELKTVGNHLLIEHGPEIIGEQSDGFGWLVMRTVIDDDIALTSPVAVVDSIAFEVISEFLEVS